MRAGLELYNDSHLLMWWPLDNLVCSIGANHDCDLCIPAAAARQASLQLSAKALRLLNHASGGTRVSGQWIQDSVRLSDGDELQFGAMRAVVRFVAEDEDAAHGRTRGAPAVACLDTQVCITVPGYARRWTLTHALSVGTDARNDIVLSDPYVSAFHARFLRCDSTVMVRDLDSRNGLFVAGCRVREAHLQAGMVIRMGQTMLRVTSNPYTATSDLQPMPVTLVGESPIMQRLRTLIGRVADNHAPVLLVGETGTGKDIVARLIVEQSPRAAQPFVPLNCGSLPRQLLESELFGHERGAFTGAVARHNGAFGAAHGGTLFLDEVGELPLDVQPQLLRVLESGEVRRVGQAVPFKVDVRLVAATNRRLEQAVAQGMFRADLLHRLHVLVLELPPLRARLADVPALVGHFLRMFTPAGDILEVSDAACAKLLTYAYPGNVRELRNILHRAVLLRRSPRLEADDLTFVSSDPASLMTRSERTLAMVERQAIVSELTRSQGVKSATAQSLGISRSTLYRRMQELGIDPVHWWGPMGS